MVMRGALLPLFAAMLAAMALAQDPVALQSTSPAAHAPLSQIAARGTFVAELARAVDARKAKAEDPIEARLTMDLLSHGEIVIPRGTRIIGHVISATAQAEEAPGSTLEIAFDHIVLKNRREIPLKATIQAVGAPIQSSVTRNETADNPDLWAQTQSRPAPGPNEMRSIAETTYPGSRRPANAVAGAGEPVNGGSPDVSLARALGPTSHGVVGMKGIALSNTAIGSAITSSGRNLRLKGGTQLVLRVFESPALADFLDRAKN
jgi:hypothetical protein